jgi:hypothetical protein
VGVPEEVTAGFKSVAVKVQLRAVRREVVEGVGVQATGAVEEVPDASDSRTCSKDKNKIIACNLAP